MLPGPLTEAATSLPRSQSDPWRPPTRRRPSSPYRGCRRPCPTRTIEEDAHTLSISVSLSQSRTHDVLASPHPFQAGSAMNEGLKRGAGTCGGVAILVSRSEACGSAHGCWHACVPARHTRVHVVSQPQHPTPGMDGGSGECGGWRAIEAQRAVKVSDVSGQHFELDLGN